MRGLKYLALGLCVVFSPIYPDVNDSEKKKEEKHALIINANSEKRFTKNVSFVDSVLSKNNYKTYIFDKTKKRDYHVNGISTKKNIENFFKNVDIRDQDLFLLYVSGHGSKDTLNGNISSTINMSSGDNLDPNSLKKYLKNIDPEKGVLIFPQCYGWEFGKEFGKENYLTISLSPKSKPSYGNYFGYGFFKSFNSPKADINKDNKISVLEASVNGCKYDLHTPRLGDYKSFLTGKSYEYSSFSYKNKIFPNKPRIHCEKTNPANIYLSEKVGF